MWENCSFYLATANTSTFFDLGIQSGSADDILLHFRSCTFQFSNTSQYFRHSLVRDRGKRLVSAAEKAMLREHLWAHRFVQAGADIEVQAAQILHAINRINQFYFARSSQLDGYALADLITSEYGVALLLDNHVNRPGYVRSCVADALSRSNLTAAEMSAGTDEDEQRVIKNYLDVRETYGKWPMTDARQRANVTRGYVVAQPDGRFGRHV